MERYEDTDNLYDKISDEESFANTDARINEHIKALETPTLVKVRV